ncbi:hypothetical protein OIO90_006011 [Microbotryomycetes sp. JL221]|nr:hypothetical protein OIO90_006011 [Microbotryomycetes sp. JL221]
MHASARPLYLNENTPPTSPTLSSTKETLDDASTSRNKPNWRPSLSFISARPTPNNNKHINGRDNGSVRTQTLRAGSVEVNIQLPSSDDGIVALMDDGNALFEDEDEDPDNDEREPAAVPGQQQMTQTHMLPTPPTSQNPVEKLSAPTIASRLRSRSPADSSSLNSTAKALSVYQPPPPRRKSVGTSKARARKQAQKDQETESASKAKTGGKSASKVPQRTLTTHATRTRKSAASSSTPASIKITTRRRSTAKPSASTKRTTRKRKSSIKPSPTETLDQALDGSDAEDPLLLKGADETREDGEGRPEWLRERSQSRSVSRARSSSAAGSIDSWDEPVRNDEGSGHELDFGSDHDRDDAPLGRDLDHDDDQDLGGHEAPIDYDGVPLYQWQDPDSDSDDDRPQQVQQAELRDTHEHVDTNEGGSNAAEAPAEIEAPEALAPSALDRLQAERISESDGHEAEAQESDSAEVTVVLDISTDSVPYPEHEYEVEIPPLSSSPAPSPWRRPGTRPSPFLSSDGSKFADDLDYGADSIFAAKQAEPLPNIPREVWTRGPAFFRSSPSPASSPVSSPARSSVNLATPSKFAPPTPSKQQASLPLSSAHRSPREGGIVGDGNVEEDNLIQSMLVRPRAVSLATSDGVPASPTSTRSSVVRRSKSSAAVSDISMLSPIKPGSLLDVMMNSPSPVKIHQSEEVTASPIQVEMDSPARLYPRLPLSVAVSDDAAMASPSPIKRVTTLSLDATAPSSLERLRVGGIVRKGRDTLSRLLFGAKASQSLGNDAQDGSAAVNVATNDSVSAEAASENGDESTAEPEAASEQQEGPASSNTQGQQELEPDELESERSESEDEKQDQLEDLPIDEVEDDEDHSARDDSDASKPASVRDEAKYQDETVEIRDPEDRLTPAAARLSLPSTTYGRTATSAASTLRRHHTPRAVSATGAPIVSVSSTDPRAAARAAAILKLYHDYVDQGLEVPESVLRDVGIRRSAIKGKPIVDKDEQGQELMREAVEDLMNVRGDGSPRDLMVAIAAGDSVRKAKQRHDEIVSQSNDVNHTASWSTKDWRRLEMTIVEEVKEGRATSIYDVDVEAIVRKFVGSSSVARQPANSDWTPEMLSARVRAIQKRRQRDAEKRLANQSVMDSTSSVRYRTLEDELANTHEQAPAGEEHESSEDSDDEEEGYNVEDDTFFERARPSSMVAPPALAGSRFSHLYDAPVSKPRAPIILDQQQTASTSKSPVPTKPPSPVKQLASYLGSLVGRSSTLREMSKEESAQRESKASAVSSFFSPSTASTQSRKIAPLRSSNSTAAGQSTPAQQKSDAPATRLFQSAPRPRPHVLEAARTFDESTARRRKSLAALDKRRRSSLLQSDGDKTIEQHDQSLVNESGTLRRSSSGKVWCQVVALEEAESSREEEQARVLELMGSLNSADAGNGTTTNTNFDLPSIKRKASWTTSRASVVDDDSHASSTESAAFVGSARGLTRRTSTTGSANRRSSRDSLATARATAGPSVNFVPSGTRALDRTKGT